MNLKQLLGLCEHKWKVYSEHNLVTSNGAVSGAVLILQCEKCGKIKSKEV